MVLNQDGVAAPHPAVTLKLAHQFLLLGIHTDDRIAAPGELLSLVIERNRPAEPCGARGAAGSCTG
jgi:hypothetical protein